MSHVLRMPHMKYQISGTHQMFEVIHSYNHLLNFDIWAWPYLWPQGLDLNKLESPRTKDTTSTYSSQEDV